METSILKTIKKLLGLAPEYTAFDLDIITHINMAISALKQIGVGPTPTFQIEDEDDVWASLSTNIEIVNMAKTYIGLKVRLAFDPPTTSFAIDAMEKQILEFEWRINVFREDTEWTDPEAVVP